jgi:hypothetical protein
MMLGRQLTFLAKLGHCCFETISRLKKDLNVPYEPLSYEDAIDICPIADMEKHIRDAGS